jgi:hypothetical protein
MPYSQSDDSQKNRRRLAGLPPPRCPRSVTSVANSDSEFLRLRRIRARTKGFLVPVPLPATAHSGWRRGVLPSTLDALP